MRDFAFCLFFALVAQATAATPAWNAAQVRIFDGRTSTELPQLADAVGEGGVQSMTAWVKPSQVSRQAIIGKARVPTDWASARKGLYFSDFGTAAFAAWDPASNRRLVLIGKSALPSQAWLHLAATYDGKTARLYVNGKLDAEQAWTGGLGQAAPPYRAAAMREFDRHFKGQLGTVTVLPQALDPGEVAALHASGRSAYPHSDGIAPSARASTTMLARRSPTDADWESFPAVTLDELPGFKPGTVKLDIYGGLADRTTTATGFFYAKQDKGRWWLVDPLGGYYLNAGIVAVTPGRSDTLRANLARRFGDEEGWRQHTVGALKDMGFNGAGAWSDETALRKGPEKFVVTVMTEFLSSYAAGKGLTRPANGHSGYVQDSLPVFLPDFEAYCRKYARERLSRYRDDPWVLGVFSDNELLTPNLKKYLALDQSDPHQAPNYRAAQAWLATHLGKPAAGPDDVTWEIDLAFQGYVFEHYFRIVSAAVKDVMPHHLYLGSRLNTERDKINPHTWRAAGKYVDVIALNLYRAWTPDLDQVADWNAWSGKPVMITEWYVKGNDAGFANTSGAGWIVPTQADRGRFYQQFTINLLRSKGVVGWHWFKYMDNDPNDFKADSSNRDSNKGLMQLDYQPYGPLAARMKALNTALYPLVDYLDQP